MKRVLACDTCGRTTSIALIEGDALIEEVTRASNDPRSSTLLPDIVRMLERAGLSVQDISLLAATIGPGSFTGIRVGLASMKGLSYATGIPLVGVGSLEALAQPLVGRGCSVLVAFDARNKELYAAMYSTEGEVLLPPAVFKASALIDVLTMDHTSPLIAAGDGIRAYACEFQEALGPRLRLAAPEECVVRASVVARLALHGFASLKPLDSLEPMYLQRPSVRLSTGARQ